MSVMLEIQSVVLTTNHLDTTGASCQWSGLRVSAVGIVMVPTMTNQRPTKTLFVINFDPINTQAEDIERHFDRHGKVLNVRIRRNFAFVQFETQEEATRALECTHMSKILDRVVSVEYALKDDSERGDRSDSPRRNFGGYRRSPSPGYRPGRLSPDYGRSRSPAYGRPHSPVYDRYNGPSYDRHRSPDYGRYHSRLPVRR